MARTDDYANAFKLSAAQLTLKEPGEVARLSGTSFDSDRGGLTFDFLGRPVLVSWPGIRISYLDGDDELPITDQVLILHYLDQADGAERADELITFREIPAGEFYYSAFTRRAEQPMIGVFGENPALLEEVAPQIGGRPGTGQGDASAEFPVLPRTPVTLVIWGGDDEFGPEGKILFDRSIPHYLSTEDVSWAASLTVYRLMRLASQIKGDK